MTLGDLINSIVYEESNPPMIILRDDTDPCIGIFPINRYSIATFLDREVLMISFPKGWGLVNNHGTIVHPITMDISLK